MENALAIIMGCMLLYVFIGWTMMSTQKTVEEKTNEYYDELEKEILNEHHNTIKSKGR